jgi:hypothetical protein
MAGRRGRVPGPGSGPAALIIYGIRRAHDTPVNWENAL